jgi:hypothetical protein
VLAVDGTRATSNPAEGLRLSVFEGLRSRRGDVHLCAFDLLELTLGIRSLHAGFGARSQWLWELPRKNEPSAKAAPEPAPVPEPAPGDWLEGVARLNPDRPPSDVPRLRWRQFVNDCHTFLSASECWAECATRLGWDAIALFGCAPRRPLDYSASAGLLWAINGGRLVELHRDWAITCTGLQSCPLQQ